MWHDLDRLRLRRLRYKQLSCSHPSVLIMSHTSHQHSRDGKFLRINQSDQRSSGNGPIRDLKMINLDYPFHPHPNACTPTDKTLVSTVPCIKNYNIYYRTGDQYRS